MKTRLGAASTLLLAAVLALSGCAGTAGDGGMPGMDHGSEAAVDANDEDIEFATTVIALHEQAIAASEIAAEKDGIESSVAELADRIKVSYETDIDQLQTWLDEWHADEATNGPDDEDADGSEDGDGAADDDAVITDADLDQLRSAEGAEAAKLYLQQMIDDHQETTDIAQEETEEGKNPGAIDLAKKMIAAQALEIDRMKEIVGSL
jgi:uncharacterized protein (DUF305 family)